LQPSLFDDRDMAEITSPTIRCERLVVCKNPLLAKSGPANAPSCWPPPRNELRAHRGPRASGRATRCAAPRRSARPSVRCWTAPHGQALPDHHRRQRVQLRQTPSASPPRPQLDGIYVIRTNLPAAHCDAAATVRAYKSLSGVEHAFRSLRPSISNCGRCSIGPRRGCARTSCSACWPIICSGTCGRSPRPDAVRRARSGRARGTAHLTGGQASPLTGGAP